MGADAAAGVTAAPATLHTNKGGGGKKTKPNLVRQAGNKITQLSSRITELGCLETQLAAVPENKLPSSIKYATCIHVECFQPCSRTARLDIALLRMTKEMKAGYMAEIKARKKEIDKAKAGLESWYALRLEEAKIVGEERAKYDSLLSATDTSIQNGNGTMNTVKKDIAPL